MKWQVDKMASRQNGKLVGELEIQFFVKLREFITNKVDNG